MFFVSTIIYGVIINEHFSLFLCSGQLEGQALIWLLQKSNKNRLKNIELKFEKVRVFCLRTCSI